MSSDQLQPELYLTSNQENIVLEIATVYPDSLSIDALITQFNRGKSSIYSTVYALWEKGLVVDMPDKAYENYEGLGRPKLYYSINPEYINALSDYFQDKVDRLQSAIASLRQK